MGEAQTAYEAVENDTLTLICPASMLASKVVWMKNGIPITTSSNLQLSASGRKIHLMKVCFHNLFIIVPTLYLIYFNEPRVQMLHDAYENREH